MHGLLLALLLWGPTPDVSGQAGEMPAPPPTVTEAAPAPENVPPSAPPSPGESARLRWLQEQLFARDALYLDHRGNVAQGGRTVDTADGYLIVGRPDLADKVRHRRTAKSVTRGVGVAALSLGLLWGIVEGIAVTVDNGTHRFLNGCGSMSVDAKCADRSHVGPMPAVLIVGGGAAWLTSALIPDDPLSATEKGRLVTDYNQGLRAGLGLSGALDTARRTARVHAAVAPDGQSGLLVAGGSF